nr:hypothetical protein [Candidatus Fimenecus sp.]
MDEEELKASDAELAEALSELRLVKDAYEIEQLRQACAATADAFAAESFGKRKPSAFINRLFGKNINTAHGKAASIIKKYFSLPPPENIYAVRNDAKNAGGTALLPRRENA